MPGGTGKEKMVITQLLVLGRWEEINRRCQQLIRNEYGSRCCCVNNISLLSEFKFVYGMKYWLTLTAYPFLSQKHTQSGRMAAVPVVS